MKESSSTMKEVLRVFWEPIRHRKFLALIIVGTVAAAELLSSVQSPVLYKQLVDTLAQPEAMGRDVLYSSAARLVFFIILIRMTVWILFRIGAFGVQYVNSRGMAELSQKSLRYILRHSFEFFTNTFSGALVRRINRFAQAFDSTIDNIIFQFIPLVLTTGGIVYVLFQRSALIGWLIIGWISVFIIVNYRVAVWRLKFISRRAEKDSEATGALSDIVSNSMNVLLFNGHAEEDRRFTRVTEELHRLRRRSWNVAEITDGLQWLLIIGVEVLILYFALSLWRRGALTVGDFVLFQGFLSALIGKLTSFNYMVRNAYESMADAKEMVDILNAPHEIKDKRHAKPLLVTRGKIEFKDVVFYYNKTRKVLDRLNMVIRPREKVALVGSSGAGKSTVVKTLFRFYDVDRGKVLIDGQAIKDVTQASLREAISLVPQEPILFHRTLMENIRYGRRDATDEEVIEAAKKAHCHEFIQALPQGYETHVGERGIKLSGGERQRVAIARAILKNAPILVLDEATSSLDSESEALIQDALHILMKNKTVIVIAHRLSTIMEMDRIIVMQGGKVVDTGTHEELVRHEGMYQKLWNIQAGGFLT